MKVLISLFFVLCSFLSVTVYAETICYDVRLNEQSVFCVKSGIGAISAESRATVIQEKLEKLSKDYTFDAQNILVVENEGGLSVAAGEVNLITLRDIDNNSNLSLEGFAQTIVDKIKIEIDHFRAERSPQTILMAVVYSFLATIVLVLALIALRRSQYFLILKLSALSEKYVSKLKIKSYQIVSPYRINQLLTMAIKVLRTLVTLILVYIYVPLVLSFFPWTAKWAPKIINYVLDPVKHLFAVVVGYIPNLFYIAVILTFTYYIMKFVKLVFNEIENGHLSFNGFHKEWAQPTFKLLKVVAYAISLIMIFPYLPGSSSPAFQGLSVFLGVLVSFGSGSAIANMISGIVMTYMRPFKLGDRVRIADTVGDVVEKTFLVTRIKTIKNVEVTIPNAMVLGSHIINYSSSAREEGLILNTTVTIGYDAPWNKVHELLKEAAAKTKLIDQEKPAFILQTSLDDFYVSYELNAYTRKANEMAQIYSDLHQNIQDSFNKGGVEIMSPHYGALRDGNEVTIPSSYRDTNYKAPGFKISQERAGKV